MRRRRTLGQTLLSTVVSTSLAIVVLGGGVRMVQTSSDLARSSAAGDTTTRRTERALVAFADAIRSGSLATFRHVDGTTFADGTFDDGISGRRVIGYSGVPVLGTRFNLRWVADASGTTGDVIRQQDGLTEVIAHGVERFRVTRNGDAFTVAVTARVSTKGSWDRVSRGAVTVNPRNQ